MAKYSFELNNELVFKTSRSGGKGGQNVNKTETKVQLQFAVSESTVLTAYEKQRIQLKLSNRINQEGALLLSSSETRSQLANKDIVINLFYELINAALFVQKKRKVSKPSKASVRKRIENKRRQAEKKENRKKNF